MDRQAIRREQASEEAEIEEMEARFRDQLQELADRKEALRRKSGQSFSSSPSLDSFLCLHESGMSGL